MPSKEEIRIGDFSTPVVPKAPASPTKEALLSTEKTLEEEAQRDEAALKPMDSYEAELKEAGLTKAKAAEIVDAVLLKGFYAENINITTRIKVRLRTRSARDTRRTQEILEAQRYTIDAHYQEALSRLLLAASLEQFNDDKFDHPNPRTSPQDVIEKAFQARVDYVDGLPDPALRVLFTKLFKFDSKISVALKEGAIENF